MWHGQQEEQLRDDGAEDSSEAWTPSPTQPSPWQGEKTGHSWSQAFNREWMAWLQSTGGSNRPGEDGPVRIWRSGVQTTGRDV